MDEFLAPMRFLCFEVRLQNEKPGRLRIDAPGARGHKGSAGLLMGCQILAA